MLVFGSSTNFFSHKPVTAAIDLVAQVGLGVAEIWADHVWGWNETPGDIRQRAASAGISMTLHAVFDDVNICSANQGIRRESLQQIEECLELAAAVGARMVTVHPGRVTGPRDTAEARWPALLETVGQIDRRAEELGLAVGIECMERRPREILADVQDVLRLFAQPWKVTGLTLDLAHTRTLGDPQEFMAAIPAGLIVHIHLSDGNATTTHLPLGKGEMKLPAILDALKSVYSGFVIMEGVGNRTDAVLRANVEYLRQIGEM